MGQLLNMLVTYSGNELAQILSPEYCKLNTNNIADGKRNNVNCFHISEAKVYITKYSYMARLLCITLSQIIYSGQ